MAASDTLTPFPVPAVHHRSLRDELRMLRGGIMDLGSFISGYRRFPDPVEVRTTSLIPDGARPRSWEIVDDPNAFTSPVLVGKEWRDAAYGMQRRVWREVRKTHNLRLNVGRDQFQRPATFGDIGTGLHYAVATGTASSPTATTWTGAAASFPTAGSTVGNTGVQGHIVFVANAITTSAFTNPVVGTILSNTATVLTVDAWYSVPVTGAAGSTPAAASAAFVLGSAGPMLWAGLSTNSSAAVATDVTRTADGLWGDGTAAGAVTEQTANGLARAYVGSGGGTEPTVATGVYNFLHTWTYTGSGSVTIAKVVLFNAAAGAGNLPFLETLLNATATVTTNGDTIQLNTWQITF